MCTYYKFTQDNSQYYCLISTRINVNDLLNNNKDTEVSYVSLTVSSEGDEGKIPHNFSISPTTKITDLNATFHYKCSTNSTSVRIHMTVFDKCGQQSDLVTQQCMSSETQGTILPMAVYVTLCSQKVNIGKYY